MRTAILFVLYPYVASALFVAGLALRVAFARKAMDATRAAAREAWALLGGSRMWRAAILGCAGFVLAGHLVALLLPQLIGAWNAVALRRYVLEAAGVLLGLALLAAWGRVMWKHFVHASGSKASELVESACLSLTFVALVSGILVAVGYRWGSSWAGTTLGPYLTSLLVGAPVTGLVERMPFLVQLHVLSLFAVAAALPFTRFALVPVLAIDGLVARLSHLKGAATATRDDVQASDDDSSRTSS
jgi:nitrate reductase gamma subunit